MITCDPIKFEDNRHLQEYVETDGSMAYLQGNTIKQLASLRKYMTLLIKEDRPADQKYNAFYFIWGEQWSNLTVHDIQTALVSAGLENDRSQTTTGTLYPISHPLHLLHL